LGQNSRANRLPSFLEVPKRPYQQQSCRRSMGHTDRQSETYRYIDPLLRIAYYDGSVVCRALAKPNFFLCCRLANEKFRRLIRLRSPVTNFFRQRRLNKKFGGEGGGRIFKRNQTLRLQLNFLTSRRTRTNELLNMFSARLFLYFRRSARQFTMKTSAQKKQTYSLVGSGLQTVLSRESLRSNDSRRLYYRPYIRRTSSRTFASYSRRESVDPTRLHKCFRQT